MKLIRGLINLRKQPNACIATIGNFDGVHLGHRAIVDRDIAESKKQNLPSCVLLFEPHPKEFFMGDNCPARISCFKEKYRYLESLGVDVLVVLQFNLSLREMKAEDFVQNILVEKLQIKHLVVGDDFHFGHKRKGNFQLLERMAANQYTLEPTPSVIREGVRISSTVIRSALAENKLELVERLLGRKFSMTGRVGFGEQIGRKLGFPTANIAIKRLKVPVAGVFLIKATWQSGGVTQQYWGVVNCGIRPTVAGKVSRVEAHLFDFNGSLYGQELTVEFYYQVREEQKFDNLDALKSAIKVDIEEAKKALETIQNK